MTDDALAVLKGMYAAEQQYLDAGGPGRASFETLAPFFAPDVVLHQADSLPYGGTWCGHAGMERFFVAMSTAWESFEMLEQEFHPAGEVVVVRTQVRAIAHGTGQELEFPILQTVHVAEGRIREVWPFYWDTAAIAAACATRPRADLAV
jgi:ketosteroid isomerase-like protein